MSFGFHVFTNLKLQPERDFQLYVFVNLLLQKMVEDESSVICSNNLAALKKVVHMKQKLKRPICRSTFEIAPGLEIGVGYYSFVR